MATQIRCINKNPRLDPHRRIEHVGGTNSDGRRWRLSGDEAIAGIKDGRYSFYVNAGGRRVTVIIAVHQGHPYLKTEADGYAPNNLLHLPECP
jgi:Protein of unknown function (DUF3892)